MSNTSQPQSFDDQVYTGFWINHAKGATNGATLTLDRQAGNFLISFLALYVGIAGQNFWTISRFLLHRYLSHESQSDGVYHQHQAILRNSRTAPQAAQETFMVMIAWRNRTKKLFFRLLPIWILASFISASFAVAGIFSSQVTANQSNEVLLRGPECGTILGKLKNENASSDIGHLQKMYLDHLNYALACYQGQQATQSSCQLYTKPKLSYKINNNATCPFDEKICQNAFDNLEMDSDYLDSWVDLGMNAEPRFQMRLRQHCAPLITDGYKEKYVDPTDSSKAYMRYSYLRDDTVTNTTNDAALWRIFMVPSRDQFDSIVHISSGSIRPDYKTRYVPIARGDEPSFVPELTRTDAISSLLFLDSTDMLHFKKVEDPWLAANTHASEWLRGALGIDPLYVSDEPATVIGCTSQILYCNPKISNPDQRCANLYRTESSLEALAAIWPDPKDFKAFIGYYATNNITLATPGSVYDYQGLPNMLARFTAAQGIQWDTLPRDQWKREMEFISQASLASYQSNVPQASQNGVWFLDRTLCEDEKKPGLCEKLCKSQKVRSSAFYSFNVLGISIIFFVGLTFMLIAGFIETIGTSIGNTFHPDRKLNPPYSRLEWESNSYLDLQRLAHQALGIGTWYRSRTGIPITAPGELLGVVGSVPKSKLPILKHPSKESELRDLESRTDSEHDSARDDVTSTRYYSAYKSLLDTTNKKQERGAVAHETDSRGALSFRYSRRPGYERVYTDEADTTHTG